jgi:hypothetical protein
VDSDLIDGFQVYLGVLAWVILCLTYWYRHSEDEGAETLSKYGLAVPVFFWAYEHVARFLCSVEQPCWNERSGGPNSWYRSICALTTAGVFLFLIRNAKMSGRGSGKRGGPGG